MTTPNWSKTFTHSIEINQFRATEQAQQDYRDIISKLIETGGSFAVSSGHLYLSEYSLGACSEWFPRE